MEQYRSHPFETGSLSADTWTKVTKTFSGDSNLQFDNDNTTEFRFFLKCFFRNRFNRNGVSLTLGLLIHQVLLLLILLQHGTQLMMRHLKLQEFN